MTFWEIKEMERALIRAQEERDHLDREIMDREDRLSEVLETNYVLCVDGETFENHMVEVDYQNGYYDDVQTAISDAMADFGKWAIYNLKGRKIVDSTMRAYSLIGGAYESNS